MAVEERLELLLSCLTSSGGSLGEYAGNIAKVLMMLATAKQVHYARKQTSSILRGGQGIVSDSGNYDVRKIEQREKLIQTAA